jgi:hypothetical protein
MTRRKPISLDIQPGRTDPLARIEALTATVISAAQQSQ